MINIGAKIKQLRKDRGITQEELAERSSLSVNYISRIENKNDLNISISVLIKIADAFNISIADLVKDTNEVKHNSDIEALVFRLSQLPDQRASEISQLFIKFIDQLR
ncbi:helix-turn-helix domain-containing protein [Limosilactobacillus antri]|uniref:helix-turn-helix domain-containing protein n=1 Tax=Limosilactobacillus antri TaxID=227943 RepID=UPI001F5803DF|nr:helix-turn-helix transcriptional regulator [Limosilactobacillus antri]